MNRCQNWPWPVGDLLSIVWTLDQNSRQCRGQKCCFSWPPKVRFQGCIALTSVRRIRPDEAEFYSPYMALLPRIRLLEKIKGKFEEYDTRLFNLVSNYDLGQSPSKLRYRFGLHYAFAQSSEVSTVSSLFSSSQASNCHCPPPWGLYAKSKPRPTYIFCRVKPIILMSKLILSLFLLDL